MITSDHKDNQPYILNSNLHKNRAKIKIGGLLIGIMGLIFSFFSVRSIVYTKLIESYSVPWTIMTIVFIISSMFMALYLMMGELKNSFMELKIANKVTHVYYLISIHAIINTFFIAIWLAFQSFMTGYIVTALKMVTALDDFSLLISQVLFALATFVPVALSIGQDLFSSYQQIVDHSLR